MINRIMTTQPAAPWGRGAFLAPPARTGLNFAITPMVASRLMMRPRILLLAVLALTACGSRPATMPDLFPESVGAWHRTAASELTAATAPDGIDADVVQKVRTASYDGPGKLDARAYQLTSAAVALDIVQRWHATADTVYFYQDRFLVVLKWQTADRKALQEFVAALDAKLKAKR